MITVGEWLGAEFMTKGLKRALSSRIQAGLAAASTEGMWSMDDIPSFGSVDEAHMDEAGKMLKRFLGTVLTSCRRSSWGCGMQRRQRSRCVASPPRPPVHDQWPRRRRHLYCCWPPWSQRLPLSSSSPSSCVESQAMSAWPPPQSSPDATITLQYRPFGPPPRTRRRARSTSCAPRQSRRPPSPRPLISSSSSCAAACTPSRSTRAHQGVGYRSVLYFR